jgi:hypothetical protein
MTTAFFVLLIVASDLRAASEQRIRALNVGAQAVMTLVSGIVQGKVKSAYDVANCLGSGAAGGYGAFAAKIQIRNGHVQQGWMLANVAASLSENAAAGKNPFAQIGYSIGPFRLRVAVPPLDKGGDAYSYVDVSAYQAQKLVIAWRNSHSPSFRSGMIVFERDTKYGKPNPPFTGFDGETWGIYPGVWKYTSEPVGVRLHETVHAVQSLQGEAVEPSFDILTLHASPSGGRRRLIRFEHLKLGLVNYTDDRIVDRQPYNEHWKEIEAYRLVQRTVPPHIP